MLRFLFGQEKPLSDTTVTTIMRPLINPLGVTRGRITLLFLAIIILSACQREQQSVAEAIDSVNHVLEKRKIAIETKDIALYKTLISPEYNDAGILFSDIVDEANHAFLNHATIGFSYQKVRPSITMNSARLVSIVEYRLSGKAQPVRIQEILYLRRINGIWLITGGIQRGLR